MKRKLLTIAIILASTSAHAGLFKESVQVDRAAVMEKVNQEALDRQAEQERQKAEFEAKRQQEVMEREQARIAAEAERAKHQAELEMKQEQARIEAEMAREKARVQAELEAAKREQKAAELAIKREEYNQLKNGLIEDIRAYRLRSPADNNALDKANRMIELGVNTREAEMYKCSIADRYVDLMDASLKKGQSVKNLKKAQGYVESGRDICQTQKVKQGIYRLNAAIEQCNRNLLCTDKTASENIGAAGEKTVEVAKDVGSAVGTGVKKGFSAVKGWFN